MQCKDAGTSGNNYSGNLLPITPVENLTSAVLGDIIAAGTEEETDEALRSRFYETFDVAAFGGNISSYKNEILSIEGVGAVQVYPAVSSGMISGRLFRLQSRRFRISSVRRKMAAAHHPQTDMGSHRSARP